MEDSLLSRHLYCIAVPTVTLALAHWFPWRRVIGHDLHRLEAYAIGTATIVGTAATAMAGSEGDGKDHALLLTTTAAAAGLTTLAAWAIDAASTRDSNLPSQF